MSESGRIKGAAPHTRRQEGSVSIVTAVLVMLALMLGLFLFDLMVFLRARGEAQTAADAAAKAAGLELTPLFGVGNDPRGAAAAYAGANGAELVSITAGRRNGMVTVTVTVRRRARTLFVPLGKGGFTVDATACCYFDPGGGLTAAAGGD